ncbi:hypothetical protein ABL840_26910 [Variovorax sp. NFACC27]|uniref:hypothetical protein n=1 Tax=unclassified Variovorax TaxID=663243 RepID=UPI000896E15A|nr:hypothetical protein SAMN03159371_03668 [Variovorax sp. NFACC28]SEG77896.1 hypothetical protein SAMN03159365_03747 [Variovorax sp. NFACC29]SFC96530.1 hypothetical protein SAMN03159379_03675 [Variovorax sp. NFACC26]SFG09559.1 hypothetical protein SAMN03159447_01784 [Variovorax sp. NFACC27]
MSTTPKLGIVLTMKLRTGGMVMDYKGGIADGLELAFSALHDKPKTRAKLLASLTQQHQRMLGSEAQVAGPEEGTPS